MRLNRVCALSFLIFLVSLVTTVAFAFDNVKLGYLGGAVLDWNTSSPLTGAHIKASSLTDSSIANTVNSDSQGSWSMMLPEGHYKVEFAAKNYKDFSYPDLKVEKGTPHLSYTWLQPAQ